MFDFYRVYVKRSQHFGSRMTECLSLWQKTCEGVNCGPAKVCQMKGGRPQCTCSPDCTNMTRGEPVCGSDSSTYRDECALLLARCQGQPDLEVMYQGECKSKQSFLEVMASSKAFTGKQSIQAKYG
uniref:Kazal-like domain-containing protein n=1 Tax=Paramormyrops kingsleyae TaxID=1676925 RepID=A0A3B3SHX9_9TELE